MIPAAVIYTYSKRKNTIDITKKIGKTKHNHNMKIVIVSYNMTR